MPNPAASPPSYTFIPCTPSSGAPPTNAIPITLQWNTRSAPDGSNHYPGSPEWNIPLLPVTTTSNTPRDMKPAHQSYITTTVPNDEWFKVAHKIFLKGRPLALGIVLITTAVLQIVCTVPLPFLVFSISFISGVHFWGGIFHIIAGSLSIAAQNKQSPCLMKGSLALCIISSLSGVAGFCLNMSDFSIINGPQYYYDVDPRYKGIGAILLYFLLFMNVLVICVSFSIAVFGCCALHNPLSNSPPTFVIQNNMVVSMPYPNLPTNTSE